MLGIDRNGCWELASVWSGLRLEEEVRRGAGRSRVLVDVEQFIEPEDCLAVVSKRLRANRIGRGVGLSAGSGLLLGFQERQGRSPFCL